MKFYLTILLLSISALSYGQSKIHFVVKDSSSGQALPGVVVSLENTDSATVTNKNGEAAMNLPKQAHYIVKFSSIGYSTKTDSIVLPVQQPLTIYLTPGTVLNEVVVQSTRTDNHIEDIPTRIEVLAQDEIHEETKLNPGNISKLLSDVSGINVQQTSAVSGNVSFRLEGLPGQYTQLLKDGFPLYGGMSSGLSLLQTPPLDLQQVEIIKGPASTLYGAGAIAGIVNLITKKPQKKPECSILLNQTSKGGEDVNSFFSEKNGDVGVTLMTAIDRQQLEDVNGDGFSDIPQYNRANFTPKLFFDLSPHTQLMTGGSYSFENREGGDIQAIKNTPDSIHQYFEKNITNRKVAMLKLTHTFSSGDNFMLKSSLNDFNSELYTSSDTLKGEQITSYSEASYLLKRYHHSFVNGIDAYTDMFKHYLPSSNYAINDYNYYTLGYFAQDNWKLHRKVFLEPGLRIDYHNRYGFFELPHIALLYKPYKKVYMRFSDGMGYKTPSIFSSSIDPGYHTIYGISDQLKAETSNGLIADVNYRTMFFHHVVLSLNQAFFYTNVSHPIIADPDSLLTNTYFLTNAGNLLETSGFNSHIHILYGDLEILADYTYTNTQKLYDHNLPLTLNPTNKINISSSYEDEDSGFRAAIEAFYTGKQSLGENLYSHDYWIYGFMLQQRFGHFTIAANVENIFDVRQSRFSQVVFPPTANPSFAPIYAPLEGRVFNVVVKFNLFAPKDDD